MAYEHLDGPPLREHYDAIYTVNLNLPAGANFSLDSFFADCNLNRPEDFTGHSMSISDILAIKHLIFLLSLPAEGGKARKRKFIMEIGPPA